MRAYFERVGLLVCLGVVALVVGAVVQHTSSVLPASYTWMGPLDALRLVYEVPWFPVAIFATLGIAELRRRGNGVFLGDGAPADRAKPVAIGLAAALFDATAFPKHTVFDVGAVLVVGMIATHDSAQLRAGAWRKVVGHVVLGALVSACICYCYTVIKALTLVGRTQVDGTLVAIESSIFGAPPHRLIAEWAATKPAFVALCDWTYFHFFHHMALVTILLTALRQRTERFEYLTALAFCYFVGAPLYHTTPASTAGRPKRNQPITAATETIAATVSPARSMCDRQMTAVMPNCSTTQRTANAATPARIGFHPPAVDRSAATPPTTIASNGSKTYSYRGLPFPATANTTSPAATVPSRAATQRDPPFSGSLAGSRSDAAMERAPAGPPLKGRSRRHRSRTASGTANDTGTAYAST